MLLYRKMVGSGLKDVVLSPWEVRLGLPLLGSPPVSSSTATSRCLMLGSPPVSSSTATSRCLTGRPFAVVLQGMWHVFQASLEVPEAQEAAQEMATFFKQHLQ